MSIPNKKIAVTMGHGKRAFSKLSKLSDAISPGPASSGAMIFKRPSTSGTKFSHGREKYRKVSGCFCHGHFI